MLRLIHNQSVTGSIYVDDIDDGLPNKQVKRMGSTANPDAYARDGYANEAKQPCYVPRVNASNPGLPGFIDLGETQRVAHSSFSGKIKGLLDAGLISVVSFDASEVTPPVVADAFLDDPSGGDLTIEGLNFLSVDPYETTVRVFGDGVGDVTLTVAQIEAVAPGSVSATEIVIDSTLLPDLAEADEVEVTANGATSAAVAVTT